MKFTSIYLGCILLIVAIAGFINSKEEILEERKEQSVFDYYRDVETLLDSLCISESDSIFRTNVGKKYLESKHNFETLIINNK